MTSPFFMSEPPLAHKTVTGELTGRCRIFDRTKRFTKDPATYSVGVSNAMTMTIPVEAHRAKRQVLDPVFSKRRVNMMEDYIYDEIDRIFHKIDEYTEKGEEVPLHEMFYCYTASLSSPLPFWTDRPAYTGILE